MNLKKPYKISILHFLPIEKYPPVMNLINSAKKEYNINLCVFTTKPSKSAFYVNNNLTIFRLGRVVEHKIIRYYTYIIYNLITSFNLIVKKPNTVIYFDTYSCLPVFLYNILFSKKKICIHYHEYVSQDEKNNSSTFYRFLDLVELRLIHRAHWISQTNNDRLQLFLKDHPDIPDQRMHILPNYPPEEWMKRYHQLRNTSKSKNFGVINIIYIGSIGINTMYVKEFATWVMSMNGKVRWDIYSDHYDFEVKTYFNELNTTSINLKNATSYFKLPEILSNYDVGVVLYKAHSINYKFNIPNKVFEYLVCGLKVLYSPELDTLHNFHKKNPTFNLYPIQFNNQINIDSIRNKQAIIDEIPSAELVYEKLYNFILTGD